MNEFNNENENVDESEIKYENVEVQENKYESENSYENKNMNEYGSENENSYETFSENESENPNWNSYESVVGNDNNKTKTKRNGIGKAVAIAVAFGIVVGLVFTGINIATRHLGSDDNSNKVSLSPSKKLDTTKTTSGNDTASSFNTVNVVKECMPSIVSITNMSIQEVQGFEDFFFWYGGQPKQQESKSVGSGIIIGQNDQELLIATNNHVVEGANTLTVTLNSDDKNPVTATLKGTDEEKDLAVVAISIKDIKEETYNQIKIATIGDSEKLEVGEPVIAIGNALGYGQSVTQGIVSAKDRQIGEKTDDGQNTENTSNYNSGEGDKINGKFIQTDAAINPGNSGGALLNSKGEVIGINTAKIVSTGAESMGYAIPISEASPIINDLMNKKTRTEVPEKERGTLGIRCVDIDSEKASMYGVPQGIYISSIESDSAAKNAGLHKGDIITKFDDSTVTSVSSLQKKLTYYKAGETIKVTYSRIGNSGESEEATVDVTLGSRKSE